MNEKVCRICRRYAGRPLDGSVRGWLCARAVEKEYSEVVPGFSFYKKDMLHPMTEDRREPPDWCERTLEQVVLGKNDDFEARGDKPVEFDGNEQARWHLANRSRNEL